MEDYGVDKRGAYTLVNLGFLSVAFSYDRVIAYKFLGVGAASEPFRSVTTSRHINRAIRDLEIPAVDCGVPRDEFMAAFDRLIQSFGR